MKILSFFYFLGSFLPSWIRIRIQQLKLMRIRIRNPARNIPFIRTTNLIHLEAEVSGWADQTGERNSLSTILWASRNIPFIRTTNLIHIEAEVPG
jgi:hypothetical protein